MLLFTGHEATRHFDISPFFVSLDGAYIGAMPLLALTMLQFSQQWRASEIFHIVPIRGPWGLQRGGQVAVLTFLAIPMFLIVVAIVLFTSGVKNLPLLLSGAMLLPLYALAPSILARVTPLSRASEEAKSAGRGLFVMLAMLGALAISGISSVAWSMGFFWYVLIIEALTVGLLCYFVDKTLQSVPWHSVE